jgi:hypothetical protein
MSRLAALVASSFSPISGGYGRSVSAQPTVSNLTDPRSRGSSRAVPKLSSASFVPDLQSLRPTSLLRSYGGQPSICSPDG